jgi:diaminopimelate epimerase
VSAPLAFSKYQASGNDFLIVDEVDGPAPAADVPGLCDRWLGVGADGVIRLSAGEAGTFRFELTNADGSTAAVSGNGLRCAGAFLHDRGRTSADAVGFATTAGTRSVVLDLHEGCVTGATVSMGAPNFTKAAIPMAGPAWETFREQPFDVGGGLTFPATALTMGNPHLVLFVGEEPERYHVEHIGPAIEHDARFPERVNVEFAHVRDDEIAVRVWERGVGETLACGSGACAVAVAANEAGLAPASVTVRFPGGPLTVERRGDGEVLLGGPVAHVFDGTADPDALA